MARWAILSRHSSYIEMEEVEWSHSESTESVTIISVT